MQKIIYWFISLTWGVVMTLIGLLVAAFFLITGHKPHRIGTTFYFSTRSNWGGGLTLGPVIITDNSPTQYVLEHEFGHSIQNLIWGPLMPFVIGIPSAIRYWYRKIKSRRGCSLPPYDSIWFEGQATRWGHKILN